MREPVDVRIPREHMGAPPPSQAIPFRSAARSRICAPDRACAGSERVGLTRTRGRAAAEFSNFRSKITADTAFTSSSYLPELSGQGCLAE